MIGAEKDPDRACHLLAAVWPRVREYAPAAPVDVQREAIIRFAGYLAQADYGTVAKESIGPLDTEYVVNHANAFRNSGAAGLLSRWRVRRAGAVG